MCPSASILARSCVGLCDLDLDFLVLDPEPEPAPASPLDLFFLRLVLLLGIYIYIIYNNAMLSFYTQSQTQTHTLHYTLYLTNWNNINADLNTIYVV